MPIGTVAKPIHITKRKVQSLKSRRRRALTDPTASVRMSLPEIADHRRERSELHGRGKGRAGVLPAEQGRDDAHMRRGGDRQELGDPLHDAERRNLQIAEVDETRVETIGASRRHRGPRLVCRPATNHEGAKRLRLLANKLAAIKATRRTAGFGSAGNALLHFIKRFGRSPPGDRASSMRPNPRGLARRPFSLVRERTLTVAEEPHSAPKELPTGKSHSHGKWRYVNVYSSYRSAISDQGGRMGNPFPGRWIIYPAAIIAAAISASAYAQSLSSLPLPPGQIVTGPIAYGQSLWNKDCPPGQTVTKCQGQVYPSITNGHDADTYLLPYTWPSTTTPPFVNSTLAAVAVVWTSTPTQYVRFYDATSSPAGSWVVPSNQVRGLTAEQIKDVLALPTTPTMQTIALLPAHTCMILGQAGPITNSQQVQPSGFWGNGGAIQGYLTGQSQADVGRVRIKVFRL